MGTVISYWRFSTARQDAQHGGDSERRQLEGAIDFCTRHKHQLSTLRFNDKARSGFLGKKQKQLAAFLVACEDGRIKAGDILLVEHLDRLGRKTIRETQKLILKIFSYGVNIAILSPHEKVYQAVDTNDLGEAIELVMFAYQAYIYSKTLSDRLKKFHEGARKIAYETGKPIKSGATPAWIHRTQQGEFQLLPEGAAAVKYIYEQTINGMGCRRVAKLMNEKFKPLGDSKFWSDSYVNQILGDKRAMGESHPRITDEDGRKIPDANGPIPGYYPAVVNEATWLAAQQAIANRRIEKGPTGDWVNLFTGLLFHAIDKCPLNIDTTNCRQNDGTTITKRRLNSRDYRSGKPGTTSCSVDMEGFEHVILTWLRELDTSVFDGRVSNALEINSIQTAINKKTAKLKQLEAAVLEDEANLPLLLNAMKKTKADREEMKAKLQELKAQEGFSMADAINHIAYLRDLDNTRDNRQKLREAIKRVVKQIVVLPVKLGTIRKAPIVSHIEITFHNGQRRSIFQRGRGSVAFSFPNNGPSLLERTDLDKHIRALKLAAGTLAQIPSEETKRKMSIARSAYLAKQKGLISAG